jgi:hypothetical protein
MSNYKIDSIGWKTVHDKNRGVIITFYALVCAVDNPDFQFSLKLGFPEWIAYSIKYHDYAEVIYQEFNKRDRESRLDSKHFSDLKCIYVNRKRLILKVFEEEFDLEKEAEKAKVLSPAKLAKLKKILHQVDRTKSVFKRKGVIFNEIYELTTASIYKELLVRYPILHSVEDLKEIVCEKYERNSRGYFEVYLMNLIRGLEKKAEQANGIARKNGII